MKAPAESVKEKDQSLETVPKMTWRNYVLLSVLFKVMFSTFLCAYIESDWTLTMLKKEHVLNMTEQFSECEPGNSTMEQRKGLEDAENQNAKWRMIYTLAETVPPMIVTLVLPAYTDVYGRKFLLLLPTVGALIKFLTLSLTIQFEGSFWFLFASHIVSGLTGSAFGFLAATFSMVADLTLPGNKRTQLIMMVECVVVSSTGIASLTSGMLKEVMEMGFFGSSLIGTGNCAISLLMAFLIPETHLGEKRHKPESVLKTVKRVTNFYIGFDNSRSKTKLYITLLMALGFATVSSANRMGMETLYFLENPFCWGPVKIGIFSTIRSTIQCLIGVVAVKLLLKCLSSEMIGMMSALSNATSYIIQAFATTTVVVYLVPAAAMFSILIIPIIRSLMSSATPADRQGTLFAWMTSIEVFCTVLASFARRAILSASLSFLSGFVFLMLALMALINVAQMIVVKLLKPATDDYKFGDVEMETGITAESATRMMAIESGLPAKGQKKM